MKTNYEKWKFREFSARNIGREIWYFFLLFCHLNIYEYQRSVGDIYVKLYRCNQIGLKQSVSKKCSTVI